MRKIRGKLFFIRLVTAGSMEGTSLATASAAVATAAFPFDLFIDQRTDDGDKYRRYDHDDGNIDAVHITPRRPSSFS